MLVCCLSCVKMIPNFGQRFTREESFEVIEQLNKIVLDGAAQKEAMEQEAQKQ